MSNNSSSTAHEGFPYILLFRLIGWGYVGMVLSIFGIIGNLITILVLISPSMRKTSTNIYLTALSCSNILFLLIFIPSYSLKYLIEYQSYVSDKPHSAFEILLNRLPTTPVYNTIRVSMIYLTVAVSLDRLILVKFPLKAKQILTPSTTIKAVITIYTFAIIYCIPYWLEQEYSPEMKECHFTTIGKKIYKYNRIYIYIPVAYLIPFVTLTCINITIIQSLIANQRRKENLGTKKTKKKQADYHITLMLVAVIIVFVLCEIPLLILNIWMAIDPTGSTGKLLFQTTSLIGILLMVLNTSTSFLLYCFFGQKFRQTLVEFIVRILPHFHKKSSLQASVARLAKQPPPPPQEQRRVPTAKEVLLKPSEEATKSNTIMTREESLPLISNPDEVLVMNENFRLKHDEKINLYTCASGKRIVLLKI